MSRHAARETLSKLIDTYLLDLARKYNVPKPSWRYTIFRKDRRWLACFDDILNIIQISKKVIRPFEVYPKEVGRLMRFTLAHEFYHYLVFLGSGLAERGLPKRIREAIVRWSLRSYEQEAADDFAEKETGILGLEVALLATAAMLV